MKRLVLIALAPLLALGLLLTGVRYALAIIGSPTKALRIAVMVDELSNVGLNGRRNETISARSAKARDAGRRWGCVLCRVLDFVQPGHCDRALADERSAQ